MSLKVTQALLVFFFSCKSYVCDETKRAALHVNEALGLKLSQNFKEMDPSYGISEIMLRKIGSLAHTRKDEEFALSFSGTMMNFDCNDIDRIIRS